MVQFFQGILEFVGTCIDLLINTWSGIHYVSSLMSLVIAKLPFMFTFLPAPVTALVTSCCAFAVVCKILGRDG